MIFNIGYKFNTTAKKWLAAFLLNATMVGAAGAAPAPSPDEKKAPRYELLSLPEIIQREQNLQDPQAREAYEVARRALQETADGLRGTPGDLPPDFSDNLYTTDNQGEEYKVINPSGDVDWTAFFLAQKTATVSAEKVGPGTVVETRLANGMIETTKTAGPQGGYRVTNPTGEQYLVDTAKFEKIYETTETPGIFRPKPDPRKVIRTGQNVAFTAPWGEEMKIRAGGALVHEAPRNVYGIQPDEYGKTYSPV